MIPGTRQGRLTVALVTGACLLLGMALSSQGGPLLTRLPLIATLTPFALASASGLIVSVAWPPSAVLIAGAAPFYSPDIRTLGVALTCVAVGMISTMWRGHRVAWFESGLLALFGAFVILLSYAAPISAPPTAREYAVYCIFVAMGVVVIAVPAAVIMTFLGLFSAYASYRAITNPTLRVDRVGAVELGTNANGLGFICAFGLVCAVLLLRRPGGAMKFVGLLLGVESLLGTVQCGSRGAFLAALGAIAALVLHRQLARLDARNVSLLVAAGAGLYLLSGPAMHWIARAAGRDTTAIAQNVTERAGATQYALHATAQHPFTGVGMASLDRYSLLDVNASYHLSAHNVFVGRFAESGIFTGAVFLLITLLALGRARRHSPHQLLPAMVYLFVAGVSIDWFVEGRLSVLSFMILGVALISGKPDPTDAEAPHAASRPAREGSRR